MTLFDDLNPVDRNLNSLTKKSTKILLYGGTQHSFMFDRPFLNTSIQYTENSKAFFRALILMQWCFFPYVSITHLVYLNSS